MTLDRSAVGDWRYLDGARAADQRGDPDLVLAHASDLHGQLVPTRQVYFDGPRSAPDLDFGDDDRRLARGGGVPLLAAKLDELRDAHECLTLMSGDTFHGSAVATYTNGRALVDPVNDHLRPDVYVPGNWDFGNEAAEDGNFRELMDALDAPVLANNLYDADGELLFEPYRVESVGGVDVGVVGATNPYVDRMAPAFWEGKYRFGKHPTLLADSARRARADGADLVVAVSEIGLPWAVQAAKDVEAVDVSLSAHTHEYTHEPVVIEDTGTVVVESGTGDALGRVDLRVRDGTVAFRHHLYCLVEDGPYTPDPDPNAAETVREVRAPFLADDPAADGPEVHHERGGGTLDEPLDTVVGETETPLHRRAFLESGWNTLFCDAVRARFDADLAVAHGFRFGPAVPPGEITLDDCYRAFPTTAPVAAGAAFGQQLTTHLESFLVDNFSPYPYQQEDGRLRAFSSNVGVVVDPTAKRKRRLVDLRVDGESVAPGETYEVATFRRPGDPGRDLGNCGFPFRDIRVDDETVPVDVVVDYLREHSPVAYEVGERVRTPDGGDVQNTPADGPYPFVQPGVDFADGEAYDETRLIPDENRFPEEGWNRYR